MEGTSAGCSTGDEVDINAVEKLLKTPYEAVFELSEDGTTYKRPASLYGVPVDRIQEDGPYWSKGWSSLAQYLARESREEQLKAQSRERVNTMGGSKTLKIVAKRHQDNVSKHRKIRQIFGPNQNMHPNQVASKRYLPGNGICQQDIMYNLGCKVDALRTLSAMGKMAMEPWDFIRWRISEQLIHRTRNCFPIKRDTLSGVIRNIGASDSDDPLFRQSMVYAARLLGHNNLYGKKKKKIQGQYRLCGDLKVDFDTISQPSRSASAPRNKLRIKRPAKPSGYIESLSESERRRREGAHKKKAETTSVWQGVNQHRKMTEMNKKNDVGQMNAPEPRTPPLTSTSGSS